MSIGAEAGDLPAAKLLLEPVLDLGAAERLHARLMDLRGQPLDIDASQVERLGGLCLQVLMSVMITSTSAEWASRTARPSSPSTAWTTLKPASFRAMASMSRMVRESSTVRMVLLKRLVLLCRKRGAGHC